MKIYHVETQGDYDALMIELEEKGCEWRCVEKPTKLDKFKDYGKDTYIYEEYGGIISFSDGYYFKVYRSNETLIEYKAKGEKMTQEEILKLKKQVEISKAYFQNILEVDPNIMRGSVGHLINCVHVIKISAEDALKRLKEVEDE